MKNATWVERLMVNSVKYQSVWLRHYQAYILLVTIFLMVVAPLGGVLPINAALIATYVFGVGVVVLSHYFLQWRKHVLKNIKDKDTRLEAHNVMFELILSKVGKPIK